jgi:uncharacterized protein
MDAPRTRPLLRAAWRHLVLVNYDIEPRALLPLVPRGTELDAFEGRSYVSVVGFLFQDTRLWGIPLFFHQEFEEINLRFYVRRRGDEGWRRGVVFVREIVSSPLISIAARALYNENYVTFPTRHALEFADERKSWLRAACYTWRDGGREQRVSAVAARAPEDLADGSVEEFITEHFWGYCTQRDGGTLEYRVEHPRWRVSPAASSVLECDVAGLYGEVFVDALRAPPASAFLAEGSRVAVHAGVRI